MNQLKNEEFNENFQTIRMVTLAKAIISGSSFCIRPAVSIKTTSNFLSLATQNPQSDHFYNEKTFSYHN